MGAVSLTTLRARARERADMVNSSFVTDAATSLDAWINEGAQRLHEKLVEAYGDDYVEKSSSFTTTSGTTDYDLPSDFFKLLGVDLLVNANKRTLLPYNRAERNYYNNRISRWYTFPRYKLSASTLRLLPAPGGSYAGTIWYAPLLQVLVHGTGSTYANTLVNSDDTINFPSGWERYVVLYAAIQALMKEESDVRELKADLDKLDFQLTEIMENRNAAQPQQAVDMDSVNIDWPWLT